MSNNNGQFDSEEFPLSKQQEAKEAKETLYRSIDNTLPWQVKVENVQLFDCLRKINFLLEGTEKNKKNNSIIECLYDLQLCFLKEISSKIREKTYLERLEKICCFDESVPLMNGDIIQYQKGSSFAIFVPDDSPKIIFYTKNERDVLVPFLYKLSNKNIPPEILNLFCNDGCDGGVSEEMLRKIMEKKSIVIYIDDTINIKDILNYYSLVQDKSQKQKKFPICFVSVFPQNHVVSAESLGVATLCTFLDNCLGKAAKIEQIDLQLSDDNAEIFKKIKNEAPDIVAISAKVLSYKSVREILTLRKSFNAVLKNPPLYIVGNIDACKFYKEILEEFPDVLIVYGEGESVFIDILLYCYGKKSLKDVSQISYYDTDLKKVVTNAQCSPISYEVSFLPPDRTYLKKILAQGGQILIEGSRGCSHGCCTFCSIWRFQSKKWRGKPANDIIVELEQLREAGVKSFYFTDSDFLGPDPTDLNGLIRIKDLAEKKIKMGNTLTFFCYARVTNVVKETDSPSLAKAKIEVLSLLKKAGLTKLFIGLDAVSDSQVLRYAKGTSGYERNKIIEVLRAIKIKSCVYGLIIYDPFMSYDELKDKIEFIRKHNLYNDLFFPGRSLSLYEKTPLANKAILEQIGLEKTDVAYKAHEFTYKDKDVANIVKMTSFLNKIVSKVSLSFRKHLESSGLLLADKQYFSLCLNRLRHENLMALETIVLNYKKNDISSNVKDIEKKLVTLIYDAVCRASNLKQEKLSHDLLEIIKDRLE